jgi:hypothetical protein
MPLRMYWKNILPPLDGPAVMCYVVLRTSHHFAEGFLRALLSVTLPLTGGGHAGDTGAT